MTAWRLVAVAALTLPVALAAAPEKKPPRGHFGSEWLGKDKLNRSLQIGVQVLPGETLDPAVYRDVMYDWRRSSMRSGPYPRAALAKEREGDVRVRLSVSPAGFVTGCTVLKSSGELALDAHACPHVSAKGRFLPRLDRGGQRIAATVEADISYSIFLKFYTVAPGKPDEPPPKPRLKTDLSLASLGLGAGIAKPVDESGPAYRLAVNEYGIPTACLIRQSGGSDLLDTKTCDALLAKARFDPARNKDGHAIASNYWGWLSWL